ncbi:MAG: tetratricopeptide repeat protein [Burkholderiales bacterium]
METSQAPAPAPAPAPAKDVPAPAKAEPVKNTAAIASTPASAAPAKNAITVPAKPAGDVPPSVSTGKPAPATQKPSPTPPTPSASPGLPSPQPARLPIRVKPPAFQANAVLESAYAAFQRGELDRARTEYQQVLGREANNRDAMLGLAAIDVRTRDYETAELRYLKLIELDPRDAHAHGALIAIQGNLDPVQLESRIKNMIASQPDATHLYFTLGNQYAAQSRWSEAQDAYFKAYSAEPDNADFAFNLAVSLDQLRQRRPAAEYYRKALGLAGNRVVGFDRKQAETRARELER